MISIEKFKQLQAGGFEYPIIVVNDDIVLINAWPSHELRKLPSKEDIDRSEAFVFAIGDDKFYVDKTCYNTNAIGNLAYNPNDPPSWYILNTKTKKIEEVWWDGSSVDCPEDLCMHRMIKDVIRTVVDIVSE